MSKTIISAKSKKYIKRTLLGLVAFFFLLLIAAIALPIIYKDKIADQIKVLVNENVNAKVDFGKVELGLIRSFPKLRLNIHDVRVVGIDDFEDVTLFSASLISMNMSVMDLIRKVEEPTISYVGVRDFDLNIYVINDSLANYMIAKPAEEAEEDLGFQFKIDRYEIRNGNLSYKDIPLGLNLYMEEFDHRGRARIDGDTYDLTTRTQVTRINTDFQGIHYITNATADLLADVLIDMELFKFSFKENELMLNQFPLNFEGYIQLIDDAIDMDLEFASPQSEFASILSVIPHAYTDDFAQLKSGGSYSFNGFTKGRFSSEADLMPAFDLKVNIEEGMAQYPGMPANLSQLFADIHIFATKPDLTDLSVSIPKFSLLLNKEKLSGNLMVQNGTTDPLTSGALTGTLKLEDWKQFFPLEGVQQLSGAIVSDLAFRAKMSDIEAERYENIQFDGKASMSNFAYQQKDMPRVSINKLDAGASPALFTIKSEGIQLGSSDMDLKAEFKNPLALFAPKMEVDGALELYSSQLNLDEWMSYAEVDHQNDDAGLPMDFDAYKSVGFKAKGKIDRIVFGEHDIKNIEFDGNLGSEIFDLKRFKLDLDGSDIEATGRLIDVFSYMSGSTELKGKIDFQSNYLDLNQFMINADEEVQSEENLSFLVPERVNMELNGSIKDLKYTNLRLKNTQGKIIIRDQSIYMESIETQTLGGNVLFDGLYSTQTEQPDFGIKFNLSQIKFAEAFQQLETFRVLAPISQYITGVFNSTLVMSGKLGENFIPDFSSLNASGFLETIHGSIEKLEILQKIGDKLNVSELKEISLHETRNWFEVNNGTLELKPYTREIGGIGMTAKGSHQLKGNMDYELLLRIPRQLMAGSTIGDGIESGLSFLEKEAGRLNVNLQQGDFIDVRVNLTGQLNNPGMKITPLGSSGRSMREELESTIKEELKAEVDRRKEEIKDTVQRVVRETEQKLRDSITNVITSETDRLRQQADDKLEEVKADATDKAKEAAEEIIKEAIPDTLKDRLKDIIDDKGVEDIKDKIQDFNPFKRKRNN
jgi:hypothetical protein